MSNPLATILAAVFQDWNGDLTSLGNDGVAAIQSANILGILPTLTGLPATVCLVIEGKQPISSLAGVMQQEQGSIITPGVDALMQRWIPSLQNSNLQVDWNTAKQTPGGIIWYLAAALVTVPDRLATVLDSVFGGVIDNLSADPQIANAQITDESILSGATEGQILALAALDRKFGQDPVTIILLIIAILGFASVIVSLINTVEAQTGFLNGIFGNNKPSSVSIVTNGDDFQVVPMSGGPISPLSANSSQSSSSIGLWIVVVLAFGFMYEEGDP